jgi:hypothetical protein
VHFARVRARARQPAKENHAMIHASEQSLLAVLPTRYLRQLMIHKYVARGWKYFVTFNDVNGFGLQAFRRADWQNDGSSVHIN